MLVLVSNTQITTNSDITTLPFQRGSLPRDPLIDIAHRLDVVDGAVDENAKESWWNVVGDMSRNSRSMLRS